MNYKLKYGEARWITGLVEYCEEQDIVFDHAYLSYGDHTIYYTILDEAMATFIKIKFPEAVMWTL